MIKQTQKTFEHLKKKWDISSNWDFFLIMVVFSLAGFSVTLCRKPLFHLFGFDAATPFWIKAVTYILLIFPIYQFSLIIFGFLLGQFEFFWEKEKQVGRAIKRLFIRSSAKV